MLYSTKSKYNVQALKVELTHYFKNIFLNVHPDRSQLPRNPLVHHFFGTHQDTGEQVKIRVRYHKTERWSKKIHIFYVEIWSTRGYWLAL